MSSPDLQGIVPRAVQAIGEGIAADTSGAEYEVQCRLSCKASAVLQHLAELVLPCWLFSMPAGHWLSASGQSAQLQSASCNSMLASPAAC
jgi:hypothetical protein